MTRFLDKSFSTYMSDDDRYRDNWEATFGPKKPEPLDNPAHLEAVPVGENNRRGDSYVLQRVKENCLAGHPYSEENTMLNARGQRKCRECDRIRSWKAYALRQQRLRQG